VDCGFELGGAAIGVRLKMESEWTGSAEWRAGRSGRTMRFIAPGSNLEDQTPAAFGKSGMGDLNAAQAVARRQLPEECMNSIQLPEWQIARLKSAAAILDATPGELAAWLLRDVLSGDQLAQVVSEAVGRADDDVRRAESLMVLGMWETWMAEDAAREDANLRDSESEAASLPGQKRRRGLAVRA
jgi:hypothetical protein